MIETHHLPLVQTASMNDAHFETITLLQTLHKSLEEESKEAILEAFQQLYQQSKSHYEHEEQMMIEKKFPPFPAHKQEHDASLEQMQTVINQFETEADRALVLAFLLNDFEPFFLTHTQTMDAVTAIFLENSEAHLPYWEKLVPRKRQKENDKKQSEQSRATKSDNKE